MSVEELMQTIDNLQQENRRLRDLLAKPPASALFKVVELHDIENMSRMGWTVKKIIELDSLQSWYEPVTVPPAYQGGYPTTNQVQRYTSYRIAKALLTRDGTDDRAILADENQQLRWRLSQLEADMKKMADEVVDHAKTTGEKT